MIYVGPDFTRIDSSQIENYKKTTPATVGHFWEKGFCQPEIKPVYRGLKLVGSAFTLKIEGKDLAAISKAYELVQKGDVLVVDGGEYNYFACAGEVSTFKSIRLGIAGLIVDGAVTDCMEMEKLNFPCFARYISPSVGRRIGEEGAVRVPVRVGGVYVNPGDLVVADDNGIVFLNPKDAEELLPKLLAKEKDEDILRSEFWRVIGKPVPKIYP